jgi:hypothetical protein
MKTQRVFIFKTSLIALVVTMLLACNQTLEKVNEDVSAFYYDEEAFPPEQSEKFSVCYNW